MLSAWSLRLACIVLLLAGFGLATAVLLQDDDTSGATPISAVRAEDEPSVPPESTATTAPPPTSTASPPTPTTSPPTPSEALTTAARLLHEGSYEAAAVAYAAVAASSLDAEVRASAALGAGVARFGAGDPEGAVAALRVALANSPGDSKARRHAAYLLALRLNEGTTAGDDARAREAATALQPYADGAPNDPLTPYILSEYARAMSGGGDSAGAATVWDRVLNMNGISAGLRADIYRLRAAAAKEAGDGPAQRQWMTRLAESTGDPAARYELATLAAAAGDMGAFAAQLRAIVSTKPGSRQAPMAVADLHQTGYAVDAGQEGLVYYRRGMYPEARRVLRAAIEEPGQTAAGLAFRTFYLAAANEDSGNAEEAVRYYDRAAAIGADSPYTHRAKYWAARVTEGTGDARGAAARYADLVISGPRGEFTAEAAFRAGYALYVAGDPMAAVETWNRTGVTADARLLYWKGRALEQIHDTAGAQSAYSEAARVGPLDFFGVEAARRTGAAQPLDVSYRRRALSAGIDWAAIETWLGSVVPGGLPGSPATAAADLVAVGLRPAAVGVIAEEPDGGVGPWRLLELCREARDAGLLDVAAQLAVRVASGAGVPLELAPVALQRVAYPIDYVETLSSQAQRNGIDPLFFAALVRQESFWDASAGSSAGALGLTQVIPPTGESIAAALGVSGFEPAQLFRAGLSIEFGTYYLGEQLRRYGSAQAALAAYNAGPGNAARWVRSAGESASPADFAEVVDIDETQHYVEIIFEHYARYLRAYAE